MKPWGVQRCYFFKSPPQTWINGELLLGSFGWFDFLQGKEKPAMGFFLHVIPYTHSHLRVGDNVVVLTNPFETVVRFKRNFH